MSRLTYADAVSDLERAVKKIKKLREELNDQTELLPNDGSCYYCGEQTHSLAGNPGLWPLRFAHADDPGVVKFHHVGCVTERLAKYDALVGQIEKPNEKNCEPSD